jgi:hypothetical protein
MKIVCIEYPNIIKWESAAEIYNADTGRYITTIREKEQVKAFLRRHFNNGELFPHDIRIEFDGATAYKFYVEQ